MSVDKIIGYLIAMFGGMVLASASSINNHNEAIFIFISAGASLCIVNGIIDIVREEIKERMK